MNEKMRKIFRHKPNRKKMDVKKVAPSQSQRKTLSKECRGAVLARIEKKKGGGRKEGGERKERN